MRAKQWAWTVAVVGVAVGPLAARASVYLNDAFDYPSGNLVGNGGWKATSGVVTFPIKVNDSHQAAISSSGQDAYVPLAGAVAHTDGASLYTGVDLSMTTPKVAGDFFLHLSDPADTTTNLYQQIFAKSSGSGYVLGLAEGPGGSVQYGSTVLSLNTAYRVVIEWDFLAGKDKFQVYVNPTSNTPSGNTTYVTHDWSSATAEPAQITGANLRQGTASLAPLLTLDNLTVASTFAEVTGLAAAPAAAAALADTAPAGNSLGTVVVNGANGSYALANVATGGAESGYVDVAGDLGAGKSAPILVYLDLVNGADAATLASTFGSEVTPGSYTFNGITYDALFQFPSNPNTTGDFFFNFDFSSLGTSGIGVNNVGVVPEPSATGLAGLGMLLAASAWRRRRARASN